MKSVMTSRERVQDKIVKLLTIMSFALAGLGELDFLPSASHWAIALSTVGAKEMKAYCPVRTKCDSSVRSAGAKSILLPALSRSVA